MDKAHFYERLMRWQHLRFNDVELRERPGTPAWNKKFEIYIVDNTRLSAQLYIRTTQPEEDTVRVMEQYLSWLSEYNTPTGNKSPLSAQQSFHLQHGIQTENCHRSPVSTGSALSPSIPRIRYNAQK